MYKVVSLFAAFSSLTNVYGVSSSEDANTQLIPNSCADLEDGEQLIKLLDGDDYPLIKVKCSNGYAILDYSLDNEISSYFTSFEQWHISIAGAAQAEHINLQEWFIPDDGNTKYLVSESCDVCDESIQEHGTTNGYYMNANVFGCFVFPRGMPDCDFDIDTLECHSCFTSAGFSKIYRTEDGADDAIASGACMTLIRPSLAQVDRTFDECTAQTTTGYKPTIGTDGKYCLCVQSSTTQYFSIDSSVITTKEATLETITETATKEEEEEASKQEAGWNYKTTYLYSADFSKGTYRIQEPGTYILMDDIEFDWNAGDIHTDPNAENAWWPTENDESYPGWGDTRDQFFMGFFAGITVETNNVIIDLNGHTLQQSKTFFYQQGFFSDIEIEAQPFLPGQGVGFFGANVAFPENIIIKNGFLGRTSHHCIHGNYNKNLLIEDIVCSEFSTHGIQLNGFDTVTIRNVEVGPANHEQYLASEYTHYRFILENMRKVIEDENPTNTIQFADRPEGVSLDDLRDKLQNEMNMALKYVVLNEEGSGDDWEEAKKVFVNPSGFGYGASMYGIFLSYPGANVLSYHINSKTSSTATLENVYIHDLYHQTKEYVGMRTDLRMFVNSFNAPLHLQYLLGDDVFGKYIEEGGQQSFDNSLHYSGNILTDSTIALHELSKNWGRLQIMYLLTDELVAWAKGEESSVALGDATQGDISYMCAVDGMIHSAKGTFGLRIDGVDSVSIDTLTIENIVEHSNLGYEICGECSTCAFEARSPYQVGYAGNMAQGISADYATNLKIKDLTINNVKSITGRTIGFSIWPGTTVTLEGNILVEHITAGEGVETGTLEYSSRPNAAPEACAIRVYDSVGYSANDNDNDLATVTLDDDVSITSSCVSGHAYCWGNDDLYSQLGDYVGCDENEIKKKETKLINIASRIQTAHKKNNHIAFVTMSSSVILLLIIVFYSVIYCTRNKKDTLLKAESERVPLMQYGSI